MVYKQIDLYEYFNVDRQGATGGILTVFQRMQSIEMKHKLRPAMLVVPGGGYGFLSEREGEPVALAYLFNGYVSFVLSYSIFTAYPTPLNEALMAMAYIKENAELYHVDKNHVGIIGFSAGGHLSGLVITATEEEKAFLNGRPCTPDAAVLTYPVVVMDEFTHKGTRDIITDMGRIPYDNLSIEKRVTEHTPPIFVWSTFEDNAVPVENSLILVNALKKVGVPFSIHIFEKGWHGLSLSNIEVNDDKPQDRELLHVGKWLDLTIDWLQSRGFRVVIENKKGE